MWKGCRKRETGKNWSKPEDDAGVTEVPTEGVCERLVCKQAKEQRDTQKMAKEREERVQVPPVGLREAKADRSQDWPLSQKEFPRYIPQQKRWREKQELLNPAEHSHKSQVIALRYASRAKLLPPIAQKIETTTEQLDLPRATASAPPRAGKRPHPTSNPRILATAQ